MSKRAVHSPRVTLYNEHLEIIKDIALSHGYLKDFTLTDPKTRELIPSIIRDIIISYGTMTTTPLYELLDLLLADMVEQKNSELLDKIRNTSEVLDKCKEGKEKNGQIK